MKGAIKDYTSKKKKKNPNKPTCGLNKRGRGGTFITTRKYFVSKIEFPGLIQKSFLPQRKRPPFPFCLTLPLSIEKATTVEKSGLHVPD